MSIAPDGSQAEATQESPADGNSENRYQITAIGFVLTVWEEIYFLLACVAIFTFAGAVNIYLSPKLYDATVLIGHVEPVENPGASAAGGDGGAFALLGGIGGSHNDAKFNLFITVIKTQTFARVLEDKYHYLERSRGLDRVRTLDGLTGLLKSILVAQDDTTDTAILTLRSQDPNFAKKFLVTVVNEGDATVRAMDTRRAQSFSSYIDSRFAKETNSSVQDAMRALVQTQERFLMITSVNLPYAVQFLDGPSASNTPVSPRKSLLLAIGFLVGFGVGLTAILLWDVVRAERKRLGLNTENLSRTIIALPSQAIRKLINIFGGRSPSK